MFETFKQWFSTKNRDAELDRRLDELRSRTPVPVFWLFGKTQSGKTSIIKYLTGAEEAEIGEGFRPCTRFSRQYTFPTPEAPLLTFVDTRGLDEPSYDPRADIDQFDKSAHVVVAVVKITDHALENVVKHLTAVRRASPDRPVILALTCLHEAYPQVQHPQPYAAIPWGEPGRIAEAATEPPVPESLAGLIAEHKRRFEGLYDHLVPIDLTKPEEGYHDPEYGGPQLKETLLASLPGAYRQTLVALDQVTHELSDLYAAHALPHILGYSSMAATAGAIPIPGLDLITIPAIQTRMIYHLAEFYGQPMTGQRFLELASTLGMGLLVRQVIRQAVKFVPIVGSVAGATLAGAATFALGKAFCFYYSSVHRGHVPRPEELRKYYKEQLALAEEAWRKKKV